MENNTLSHAGIKGMRWGIRRFQNKDGSLTPEGKKRYADDTDNSERKNETAEERKQRILRSGSAEEVMQYQGRLTNKELQEASDRIRMENQLRDVSEAQRTRGVDKFAQIMNDIDKVTTGVDKGLKAWNMIAKINNTFNKHQFPTIEGKYFKPDELKKYNEEKQSKKEKEAKKTKDGMPDGFKKYEGDSIVSTIKEKLGADKTKSKNKKDSSDDSTKTESKKDESRDSDSTVKSMVDAFRKDNTPDDSTVKSMVKAFTKSDNGESNESKAASKSTKTNTDDDAEKALSKWSKEYDEAKKTKDLYDEVNKSIKDEADKLRTPEGRRAAALTRAEKNLSDEQKANIKSVIDKAVNRRSEESATNNVAESHGMTSAAVASAAARARSGEGSVRDNIILRDLEAELKKKK